MQWLGTVGHLGVGGAEVRRPDLVRGTPAQAASEPTMQGQIARSIMMIKTGAIPPMKIFKEINPAAEQTTQAKTTLIARFNRSGMRRA